MRNIFILFLFVNFAYAQSFECDNNFGDCGTPEQSGGGGGKGSVLIANTDLGDTYQHADDYDDDGIEDLSDNCMRDYNPPQLDSDADTIGDMCDNCIGTWNLYQDDSDGDGIGDSCDDDIDGDGILNSVDSCPYHWGNSYCLEESKQDQYRDYYNEVYNIHSYDYNSMEYIFHEDSLSNEYIHNSNCDSSNKHQTKEFLVLIFIAIVFAKLSKQKRK